MIDLKAGLTSRTHSEIFSRERARVVLYRVRLIAALFAVVTPFWAILDHLTLPPHIALRLGIGRFGVSAAFMTVALLCRCEPRLTRMRSGLFLLFIIPAAFFVYSRMVLSGTRLDYIGAAMASGYTFLPFILTSGIAVFPLTFSESVALAAPILAAALAAPFLLPSQSLLPGIDGIAILWLLVLVSGVAAISAAMQLFLMRELFARSSADALTGALNRKTGEEVIALQVKLAARHRYPLALAFLDIDDFKSINDRFGHAAGDRIIVALSTRLRSGLRASDAIVRWGGEEFVLLFPHASAPQAARRIEALLHGTSIIRPDEKMLTASVGIASDTDHPTDWRALVTLADERMYQAKQLGKNRIIGPAPRPDVGQPATV